MINEHSGVLRTLDDGGGGDLKMMMMLSLEHLSLVVLPVE